MLAWWFPPVVTELDQLVAPPQASAWRQSLFALTTGGGSHRHDELASVSFHRMAYTPLLVK
jgi:hypothetical protein